MSDPAAQDEETIEVRPMAPGDAEGLVELVRSTYGEDYVHEEIYHPDLFVAAQERGEHISEVAVTSAGKVVGHCAFTFHGPRVAEGGMAITHPDYRGHGIAIDIEQNLMRRLDEMGVRWIMGEPVLIHTATQEIVLEHWANGGITGFRLKGFHPVASVGGFEGEAELGRISVAMGFCPLDSMVERRAWVSPAYAPLLERALAPTSWPREIVTAAEGPPVAAESVFESDWDADNGSARIVFHVIGADIEEAVAGARDEAVGRGAKYIELRLPVGSSEAAGVDLRELGFSYAAFLPEMGEEGDMLLLQWLEDAEVDRSHWHLINDDVEALADMVIAQAGEAYEMSRRRS
ncbi:MAG: GNAT family N-acetyltransferase [Solirubrobacterales bacterium]